MNWACLRYVTREGGAWRSESIGASLAGVNGWEGPLFALEPAGRPHVMLPKSDTLLEMARSDDGTWTSQGWTGGSLPATGP